MNEVHGRKCSRKRLCNQSIFDFFTCLTFIDRFSFGRQEEPLLVLVLDAGEPEANESGQDVDDKMAGRC
jgi:hypothetical protein